jgi:hypothetical protein
MQKTFLEENHLIPQFLWIYRPKKILLQIYDEENLE